MSTLTSFPFAEASATDREAKLFALAEALDRAGDSCAHRSAGLDTVARARRALEFDDSLTQVERILNSVDAEVKEGRGDGGLAYGQLAVAEALLRSTYQTTKAEVGSAGWNRSLGLQTRFQSSTQQVYGARDEAVLAELEQRVVTIERNAATCIANDAQCQKGTRHYQGELARLEEANSGAAQLSGKLMADSSMQAVRGPLLRMRNAAGKVRDKQYERYLAWASGEIQAALTNIASNKTSVIGVPTKKLNPDEARAIAVTLFPIDPNDLPSALAEAWNKAWSECKGEVNDANQLLKERIAAPKVSAEQF